MNQTNNQMNGMREADQGRQTREYTCVVCPNGCQLRAEIAGAPEARLLSVAGNLCPRGARWVRQEVERPMRTFSTSVLLEGGRMPVASVRTLDAVPLKDVLKVRESLRSITLRAPVQAGDIIATEPAGVPCRVAVTRSIPHARETASGGETEL